MAVAGNPRSQFRPLHQTRNIEDFDVFHPAASIAEEMMMSPDINVVSDGAGAERHLLENAGAYESVQVVIYRRPRCAGIRVIDPRKDLLRGEVTGALPEMLQHRMPLGRVAQSRAPERLPDLRSHVAEHQRSLE